MSKAYLILEDGSVFEGTGIGAPIDAVGELVFTTGMCGYVETLTDPSYAGQIVMQTFPMIGNYGVMEADFEGDCALRGYVVRECCTSPSNFRFQYDLNTFLKKQNIPGISGIDTRQITALLRKKGTMKAILCSALPSEPAFPETGYLVPQVSAKAPASFPAEGGKKVAVLDLGLRRSLIHALTERGCEVTVFPYNTTAQELLDAKADGLILSTGPGNPMDCGEIIQEIAKLVGKLPIFGIGLGHELLALAQGGKTYKLPHGHRGENQPVKDIVTGLTHITSQNHGYCVDPESLPGVAIARWVNVNDGSCEGLDYPGKNCFSVQFYPEACAGTRDTQKLMERFIDMMGGNI